MLDHSIIVFTHRSSEFLIKLNGSTSWKLNPTRARDCEYVICTRNRYSALSDDKISHRSAFLVGRISNIVQSLNLPRDEKRYMIEFHEYAEVSIPNIWEGWRGPVKYMLTRELDIDFENLNWKTVPNRDIDFVNRYFSMENAHYDREEKFHNETKKKKLEKYKQEFLRPTDGISIDEAKKGLSEFYGISEKNIEIILKG